MGFTVRPAASLYAVVKSPMAAVNRVGEITRVAGPAASTVYIIPVTSVVANVIDDPVVGLTPISPVTAEAVPLLVIPV